MGLSQAQLAQRLTGITATDVAAIVGVNPHRSRIDVWREKRGEAPPWVDTERSKWGELLEPVVREDYAARHELRVEVPGTLAHPDRAWMMSTPDGICYRRATPAPERGMEIKCHTWRVGHLYGRPGTDEIPLWELCQCAWNLGVTGLPRWDLVAFIDGQPTDYIIDRDDDLIAGLVSQCERFLVDNVRGGAYPDPDGTEQFTTWLKGRWDENNGKLIDIADDTDTLALIERARQITLESEQLDDEITKIEQTIKLRIADSDGLTWRDARKRVQKLTWKRNKSSVRIAVGQMATDMRNEARLTLSALAQDIDRARVCLDRVGPSPIGENARAAITGREISEMIHKMACSLRTIIEATESKYTTTVPGARPFNWPTTWRKNSKERKEQDT